MSQFRSAIAALLVGFLLGTATPVPAAKGTVDSRPNILVIITDDQRTGTMGVMPKTRRWLPVNYPRAFVSTPICCPSRASIFTGRYANDHGVKRLGGAGLDHSTTIQAMFRDAGYRTGFFGKFFARWDTADPPPYFDEYAVVGNTPRYYDVRWGSNVTLNDQLLPTHEETVSPEYSTSLLGRYGEIFIGNNQDQPWLAFLSTTAPHIQPIPEHTYADATVRRWRGNPATREKDLRDKPGFIRKRAKRWARVGVRAQQLRTLMSVDDMVDRVMTKLQETGQLDNTLVVFISDNGYLWGEHGQGGKNLPYRESIKVPMRARFPDLTTKAGIVANIDIGPTALNAANLSIPKEMDGHSLLDPGWQGRKRILAEFWCKDPGQCNRWASVRHISGWQYVEHYRRDGSVKFREWYKRHDRWQLTNLFRDGKPWNNPHKRARRLHRWIGLQGYRP